MLHNPALADTTNTTVRVVQYLNLGACYHDSEFSQDATGRGSLRTDFLSSAIILQEHLPTQMLAKQVNMPQQLQEQFKRLRLCLYKNYRIVDIVINPTSALQTSIDAANNIIGVLIGLQFDSGATDDLFLTLKRNTFVAVDLDSSYTRNAGHVIGPLVDSGYGPVGSIELTL